MSGRPMGCAFRSAGRQAAAVAGQCLQGIESGPWLQDPNNGYLVPWAEQGVLLLNAVLTVAATSRPAQKPGWETFTDAVISALNERPQPVVFLLWGAIMLRRKATHRQRRHRIVTAAHPSPAIVQEVSRQ